MEKNKNISNTKDKALKRRKIIRDMLQTISFYENRKPARKVKNNVSKYKSKTAKTYASPQSKTDDSFDVSSQRKQSRDVSSHNKEENAFALSSEEKSALDLIIRQIQNLDEDEMHEITYDRKIESITIIEKKDSFLDFETDFDPAMLWKDTNLDDYSDLFTQDEILMLKDKQKMFLSGEYVPKATGKSKEIQKIDVCEEDFSDEMVAEEDFADEIVTEDDFADEMVAEDDFADEMVTEEDFSDEMVTEDDFVDEIISEEDFDEK